MSILFRKMRPLPDAIVRWRARRALGRRLETIRPHPEETPAARLDRTLEQIRAPARLPPAAARLDRAALPVEFWETILGSHCSATTGFWPRWAKDTEKAETEWLQQVAERASLSAGQRILEVGASLGAVARWAESQLPGLDVTLAAPDPAFEPLLRGLVAARGPGSARLAGALSGVPATEPAGQNGFDRILVIEALSRVGDPLGLLHRLLSRLAPGGRLFLQIVCHWRRSYFFEPGDEHRWMLFDTPDGALLPGDEELSSILRGEAALLDRWELSGEHYERTVRAWRSSLDRNRSKLEEVLGRAAVSHPARTLRAWRSALVAQEAMFGYREGQEWTVTQMLLGAGR